LLLCLWGISYLGASRLRVDDVARVNGLTVVLDQLLVAVLAAGDAADIFAVADDGDGDVAGGLVDVGVLTGRRVDVSCVGLDMEGGKGGGGNCGSQRR